MYSHFKETVVEHTLATLIYITFIKSKYALFTQLPLIYKIYQTEIWIVYTTPFNNKQSITPNAIRTKQIFFFFLNSIICQNKKNRKTAKFDALSRQNCQHEPSYKFQHCKLQTHTYLKISNQRQQPRHVCMNVCTFLKKFNFIFLSYY